MGKKNVHPIVSGAGWIGSFAGLLVEELDNLGVSFEDIHKLGKPTKEGRSLVRICAEKIAGALQGTKSGFLKLIFSSENFVIDMAGTEILAEADDVFGYIDSDFRNWKADEPGKPTGKTQVHVYEMTEDATFAQMFGSLSPDVARLCFTQAQIKGFVKKYRQWLRSNGYSTLFLFRSHEQFFVAYVSVLSDGLLLVSVHRFENFDVWHAGNRRRVVVPWLA